MRKVSCADGAGLTLPKSLAQSDAQSSSFLYFDNGGLLYLSGMLLKAVKLLEDSFTAFFSNHKLLALLSLQTFYKRSGFL